MSFIGERHISRRKFLAVTGGAAIVAARGEGIVVPYTNHPKETLTDVPLYISRYLAGLNLITIAHRDGNSLDGIVRSAKNSFNYADVDLNKVGSTIYIDHGINVRIPFSDKALFGVDQDPIRFRLGGPTYKIDDAIRSAIQIGLCVEPKRGIFTSRDYGYIENAANFHNVGILYQSMEIDELDIINRSIGDPNRVIYTPDSDDWKRLLRDDSDVQRKVILTNLPSAWKNIRGIVRNGISVVIGEGAKDIESLYRFARLTHEPTGEHILKGLFNYADNLKALTRT